MNLITVTALTCNDDKTIDLAVSIDAEGYYVSIVGCAEEQQISSQTATLSNCSLIWVCAFIYLFFLFSVGLDLCSFLYVVFHRRIQKVLSEGVRLNSENVFSSF